VIITYYEILLIIDLSFTRSFKQVLSSLNSIKIVLFLINLLRVYLNFYIEIDRVIRVIISQLDFRFLSLFNTRFYEIYKVINRHS